VSAVVPSPARIFARLALVMTLAALGAALCVALLLPLVLGAASAAGARTMALSVALGGSVLAVLLAIDTGLRVRPIHRYFARLARSSDAAPPSDAAIRDAFTAPMRIAVTFFSAAAALGLADALGLAALSGVAAWPMRARLDVAAWLVVVLLASPLRLGVEWALREWLTRIDPAEIFVHAAHALAPRSFADRLALRAAVPAVASTLLVATGLASRSELATQRDATPLMLAGVLLATGIGVLAYWLARRTAATTAGEVRALAAYALSLGPDRSEAAPPPPPPGSSSADLHAALLALSIRLDEVRANEAHAHRTMVEAQQLKTQFLASMSHDLRSPLNSILGFSEVLLGGLDGPLLEPQRESVLAIQRAGDDLLRLLTDVLDSARLEAGRLELRRAWTPSVEIVTEAVRRGKTIAAERGDRALSIEVELQPGLPPVYVDSDRVVQAVVGLFGHAARVMDGGTIRLRARVAQADAEHGAQVRIEVTDTGGDIPESDRERIFEAFRGARGGVRLAGLGLGLALARSLVRAHGGEVSVASAADGTTFTVALPTDGPMPAGTPAGTPARRQRR